MSRENRYTDIDQPPPPEEKPTPPTPEKKLTIRDLEAIVPADFLLGITQAAGKFTFRLDTSAGPNTPLGYTDRRTRVIYLNPYKLEAMKLSKDAIAGLLVHEAGHHAPEVVDLDQAMMADLSRPDLIPKELTEKGQTRIKILKAISRQLHNALLDRWLEEFMSRRTMYKPQQALRALYDSFPERKLTSLPKPEQLMQLLVAEDHYPKEGAPSIRGLVDPDVYETYQDLKDSGAFDALDDRRVFENYFAKDNDLKRALTRKFDAYRDAFLPAWLKLFAAEAKEREEKKQQQKGKKKPGQKGQKSQGQGGEQGEPEEGEEGEEREEGEEGKGKGKGKKEGQKEGEGEGEYEDLTPEEIAEILEQLAEELEKAGDQYKSQTPSEADESKKAKSIQEIIDAIKSKEGQPKIKPEGPKMSPEERINKAAQKIMKEFQDKQQRGMAENMGIKIESVQTWEEIKKERQLEIETAAAQIADVFLDDRRKRIEYMLREGEIVPGLEYEWMASVLSGDISPQTHMRQVRNPEFLETEVEFIQDVSGSMSGEPLRKCLELIVILAEAFRKVREGLAAEQLLDPSEEEPLRIGVTKFETTAERVKKLQDRMDDQVEMTIIDELTKGGGGTDEEQALTEVYGELTLHQENILKIMVILSDGHGNKVAVQRIMNQIEQDNKIVVAVVGLGGGAKAVVEAYSSGLTKGEESNVHPFEAEDPSDMLPALMEFFRVEINKRRRHLG